MFNRYINRLKKDYRRWLIALCSAGLCCPCLAGNLDTFNERMEITPIRYMSNQALFESAQLRREKRICAQRYLMNSQWLMQSERNTWTGSGAIRKLLQRSFGYLWRSGKTPSVSSTALHLDDDASEGWLLPNYGLSVSEEEAHLKIKLRF